MFVPIMGGLGLAKMNGAVAGAFSRMDMTMAMDMGMIVDLGRQQVAVLHHQDAGRQVLDQIGLMADQDQSLGKRLKQGRQALSSIAVDAVGRFI